MTIDKNNPLEQQNNPDRDGSNGSNVDASTRRRKKPRRNGKGSNTQTNNCGGDNTLGCKSNDHGKDHCCWSTNKRNEGADEHQNSQRRSYGDSQYLQEDSCI